MCLDLLGETLRTQALPEEFNAADETPAKASAWLAYSGNQITVLLWVVCRVGKYTWKDSPGNPIATLQQDPVYICMHELVVEE